MTSCFVYKVMGLTFHDRINTQLINRIAVAQVVTRRITKPQRTFLGSNLTGCYFYSFFFSFFFFGGGGGGRGGGGGGLILLFSSCLIYFSFYLFLLLFFIPLTCIRYIYKNSVTTQATVNYEIHANVSVKRHICDVKICDKGK